jgi:hypothetical protein
VSCGDLSSAAERASDFGEVFIGFSERRKKTSPDNTMFGRPE